MRNLAIGIGILFVSLAALALASGWGFSKRVKTADVPSIVAPLVKAEAVKQVTAALKAPETRKLFAPTQAELKVLVATAITTNPTIINLTTRKGLDEDAIVALIKKTVTTDPKIAAYIASKTGSGTVTPFDEDAFRILVINILSSDPAAQALLAPEQLDVDDLFLRLKQDLIEDQEFLALICCNEPAPLPVVVPPVPVPEPAPVVVDPVPTPPAPKKPAKAKRAGGSWTVTQTVSIVNNGSGSIRIYHGDEAK